MHGKAKEQAEIEKEKEIVDKAIIQAMGKNKRGDLELSELQDELNDITKAGETEVSEIRKKLVVEFTDSNRMYYIDDSGNVYEYVYTELAIMEDENNFYNLMADYRTKISTVTVLDNMNIPENFYQVFDVSKEQNESVKAWLTENQEKAGMYNLYIGGNGGVEIENCSYIFSELTNCTEINLENLYTENVQDFSRMFWNDTNLVSINLNNLNTSKATTMNRMFNNCSKLQNLDLSNFKTDNLTDMYGMFYKCTNLENIDLRSFNTSKVTSMGQLFNGCENIKNLI